ncbi:MAG: hypothetical protein R6U38_11670 [Desulfatiglandaceae bacterium]
MGPSTLALPFKLTLSEAHPYLTLGDYFEAIQTFLLRNNGKSLKVALQHSLHSPIDTLLIRSEKHGALYHIASVEIFMASQRIKLAVSTALSETGKACLNREYDIIHSLRRSHPLPYLPAVYVRGRVDWRRKKAREDLVMVLSQWFEDFHEWHTTHGNADGKRRIRIWDHRNNNPYLSREETFQLFRQASKILTLYYDPETFRQIYPWHHAAGDFVVSTRTGIMEMRLATVRKYASIMEAFTADPVNPLIAMVYFFLNLTIRMRLDRLDGVGDTIWSEDFAVEASTQGFFEAVEIMHREKRFTRCGVEELVSLLQSFEPPELERLFQSLCGLYQEGDPEEYAVIQAHLQHHVRSLYPALQKYH